MIELVFLIILICSLTAVGIMALRKIPRLLELPETVSPFNWKDSLLKIKNSTPLKKFSLEIFLQKILSKIRILTLKTDNKTSSLLQNLRARSLKKKFGENDNYWKEIRKSTKKK